MLDLWLTPTTDILPPYEYQTWQLGSQIISAEPAWAQANKIKTALIGIFPEEAAPIRRALYQMAHPWKTGTFADFGNVRNTDPAFIEPLLAHLVANNICPIIIGGQSPHQFPQYNAFKNQEEPLHIAWLDERLRSHGAENSSQDAFIKITQAPQKSVYNVNCIGWQQAYSPPEAIRFLQQKGFDAIRLGAAQNDKSALEPLLRDIDMLSIHLSVLGPDFVPGCAEKTSSVGFNLADICQIARYGSSSHRLASVSLVGYSAAGDPTLRGAEAVANLIWYILDGIFNRVYEYPTVAGPQWQSYVVNSNGDELIFWRSGLTQRWWLEVQLPDDKRRFVPCAQLDYDIAAHGDMPERLFRVLQRLNTAQ